MLASASNFKACDGTAVDVVVCPSTPPISISTIRNSLEQLPMVTGNLFANVPERLANEAVEELLSAPNVRIERIVSIGHATAADEWYDQDRAEWVVLLAGSAGLLFEGDTEPHPLVPGSYVHIPAHRRHRVAWTDRSVPTIWLAIHYQ
jgi:cupin 2 domain-containing protein